MAVPRPLVEAIMNGNFDTDLERLANLVQRRREMVGQQLLFSLSAGDAVRFNQRVRPQYLRGVQVAIHHVDGDKAYVRFDRKIGKYRDGSVVGCAATILERVP